MLACMTPVRRKPRRGKSRKSQKKQRATSRPAKRQKVLISPQRVSADAYHVQQAKTHLEQAILGVQAINQISDEKMKAADDYVTKIKTIGEISSGLSWYRERIERDQRLENDKPTERRPRRKRQMSLDELAREKGIRKVIKNRAKGLVYCKQLDTNGIKILPAWILKGCPKTYHAAYFIKSWRRRIEVEKSNLKLKKLKN
jgi:hypothetical protein